MKRIFTLITAALIAVCANAEVKTIFSYTVESNSVTDNAITVAGGTIELHGTTVEEKAITQGPTYGAKLTVSDSKYVEIQLAEELQKDDIVEIQFYVSSNSTEDNTNGIDIYDNKKTNEGALLATYFVQMANKKDIVTGTYLAAGGEKRFNIYAHAGGSSVYFKSVSITRVVAEEGAEYTLDLTATPFSQKADVEAAFAASENITIVQSEDGDTPQCLWKNDAGAKATVTLKDFPMSITYKNSSSKEFIKSADYIQFNNSGSEITITCKAGQFITLYPKSYGKEGKFSVTGSTSSEIVLPVESTEPVSVKAIADNVVLKTVGACRIQKFTITNEQPTGIYSVATTPKAESIVKYIRNGQLVIEKNNLQYNIAGSRIK